MLLKINFKDVESIITNDETFLSKLPKEVSGHIENVFYTKTKLIEFVSSLKNFLVNHQDDNLMYTGFLALSEELVNLPIIELFDGDENVSNLIRSLSNHVKCIHEHKEQHYSKGSIEVLNRCAYEMCVNLERICYVSFGEPFITSEYSRR